MTNDLTTLVCLFHHPDQAKAAINDLREAGVAESSISRIDHAGSGSEQFAGSSLDELQVPERDQRHLLDGLRNGGVIVGVSADGEQTPVVERIFGTHYATKIDEATLQTEPALAAPLEPAIAAGETAIPIVEEELVVGKRAVDQGGVRVYRRIVEIPVEEAVSLREEHVSVERHAVDRAVTEGDLALQGDQTIELIETAEEAVVGKSAQVVEEVHVGKVSSERTEHIHDTVRQTEVEVEEIGSKSGPDTTGQIR